MKLSPNEGQMFLDYIRENGRLPPTDHPTMGEFSDFGRNRRPLAIMVVLSFVLPIGFFLLRALL